MASSPPIVPKRSPPDAADPSSGAAASGSGQQAKRTRSRNGCLVCRARRIKCDLERPECRRCVNYGAECVYPVKKAFSATAIDAALGSRHNRPSNAAASALAVQAQGGGSDGSGGGGESSSSAAAAAAAAAMAASSAASSTGGPHSAPSSGLDTVSPMSAIGSMPPPAPMGMMAPSRPGPRGPQDDQRRVLDSVPPLELVHALFRKTKMGSFFNSRVDPPEFLSLAFPEPEDLRCFHHCLTYSLSIMVIDESHNPWIEHVAPLFLFPTGDAPLSTSALKYTMLAIGATHLAYLEATSRVPNAEHTLQLSKQYRHNAISLLREARRLPSERESDSFLTASLMMVVNDLFNAQVSWREPWRYVKAAIAQRGGAGSILFGPDWRSLLSRRGGTDITPPLSLCRYVIELGVMHDIFAAFTTGESPTLLDNDSPWWEALSTTGATDREWESIESLVGSDRGILRLVSCVLTIYAAWLRFESHYQPLHELDGIHHPPTSATMEHMSLNRRLADIQMDLANWRAEAPTRYMSARTLVGSMALYHTCQILILRDMQKRARDDVDVQAAAYAILELCIEVGDKVEFLNWPLIAASSVILEPAKRDVARGIIKTFAYQCCHEIESTRMVIEEMWRRIDEGYDDEACNWREITVEIGRPVLIG